jgi:hypothetical protein
MSYNYPQQPRHYEPDSHPYPNPSYIDEPGTRPVEIPRPNRRPSPYGDDILPDAGSYYRSPTHQLRSPISRFHDSIAPDAGRHGRTVSPDDPRLATSPEGRHGHSLHPDAGRHEAYSARHRQSREQPENHRKPRSGRGHHRADSYEEELARQEHEIRSRERQRSIEQQSGYHLGQSHHMSLPRHMSHQFGSLPPQLLAMGHTIAPPGPTIGPMMGGPQEGGPSQMDYATFSALSGNNVRMNPFATPHTAYPNAMPLSSSLDLPPLSGYGSQRYRSFAKPGELCIAEYLTEQYPEWCSFRLPAILLLRR